MNREPGADAPNPDPDELHEWEWSDEGLFVRDVDGRLIRYDRATRDQLDTDVTLEIDGQRVVVKKAVVATDEQGLPRRDAGGEVIPRPTTIYDAVTRRYEEPGGGGSGLDRSRDGAGPGPVGDGAPADGPP